VVLVLAGLLVASAGTAGASPRCFGAASRDSRHHCTNPSLRFSVSPTPQNALLETDAPCAPIDPPIACSFGVPADRAIRVAALVGDSHAQHWRSSVQRVAVALHWSVALVAWSSCPFTRSIPILPGNKPAECRWWNQTANQWLADHPQIDTVFMSNHPGKQVTRPGQSQQAARVEGILAAWKQLPPSVKHIIVIRDGPFSTPSTLPCVERAIARHRNAGLTCARSRKHALHSDPYLVAAQQLHSPRVQTVDLSSFFCSSRLCFPVVGGALVYRDYFDHLTPDFARTLGPYLLDRVRRLMRAWS
jgi:hypothetical protein